MSIQATMKATLEKTGIPHKEIKVYGSQIVITSWSEEAAKKWADVLSQFATVRCVTKNIDYAKHNKNTVMKPSTVDVYRTFAAIN